jgi:hypothetical protein
MRESVGPSAAVLDGDLHSRDATLASSQRTADWSRSTSGFPLGGFLVCVSLLGGAAGA